MLFPSSADACPRPERLQYAELDQNSREMQSFPVGSRVSFICRPGYVRAPEMSLTWTCGADLRWSPTGKFCTGDFWYPFFPLMCNSFGWEWELGFCHILNEAWNTLVQVRAINATDFVCNYKNVDFFFFFFSSPPERKCMYPGDLENGYFDATDLTFGSKLTFSCKEG